MLTVHRICIGKNEFGHNYLRICNRVHPAHIVDDVLILETTDHMDEGIYLPYICQKFVPQSLSLTCTGYQSGNIHHLNRRGDQAGCINQFRKWFEPCIGHLNYTDIWIDGTEWIVGCLRLAGLGQGVKQCAFAHIGQT